MKIYFAVGVLALTILACGGDRNVNEIPVNENSENINSEESVEEAAPPSNSVITSISNPAPQGTQVVIDDISYEVISSIRPATDIVMAGDEYNNKPFDSEEYILVGLEATCQKPSSEDCHFSLKYISLFGSYGEKRFREVFMNGVDGLMESADFKGGESIRGTLPFIIPNDESDLMLVVETVFGVPSYLGIN
ncbi:MAG: hypothetical protein HON98_09785 [Chloroflexi bacterium]|jgi:hypothetical protein|nr:hypothetical protein [Chloroflexota bacterium]MBT4533251.1 hypothetical protein [Chloroflexota bacterium]MBT4755958.1 hypothetical protein [Chloroflexota bacterium]MBT6152278.1 hypothetical protein [Chloroflexota bacterium]MBT7818501.1 hypothetical protein [Chloroflexota bacterium]